MPVVSVIIGNRNDTAMLALTARSCLEEFKAVPGGGEVVICDNSDKHLYDLIKDGSIISTRYFKEERVRLLRQEFPCLFTAREAAIKAARGKYVLCLDSHMLVGHNMIIDLVNFMNRNKHNPKIGFAHAPIAWLHQHESHAKHDRVITEHELGSWGPQYDHERKITWKGMPWICRKGWFLNELGAYGALAKHRISWGGGDMYIGTKPWLLGYQNWAVPTSPAIHIGPFPQKVADQYKYRLFANSGEQTTTIGFLIAAYALGGEEMMKRIAPTVKERFGLNIDTHWEKAKQIGQEDRDWLQKHCVMSYPDYLRIRPWTVCPHDLETPKPSLAVKPIPEGDARLEGPGEAVIIKPSLEAVGVKPPPGSTGDVPKRDDSTADEAEVIRIGNEAFDDPKHHAEVLSEAHTKLNREFYEKTVELQEQAEKASAKEEDSLDLSDLI